MIENFFKVLLESKDQQTIMEEFKKIFKIDDVEILKKLIALDSGNIQLIQLSEKNKYFLDFISKNEGIDEKIKNNAEKMYKIVEMQTTLLIHMRGIDDKTERNKQDLLERLEEKEKSLKISIDEYARKVEKVDEETMKKMGMYLSIFTLIAGNISVLFKGIEVSPFELAGLIFIVNATLLISIQVLFYFINKDKKISGGTAIIFILGIVLGGLCLFFNPNSYIKRNIEKDIKAEYEIKFKELDNKIRENEKLIYKLEIEKDLKIKLNK